MKNIIEKTKTIKNFKIKIAVVTAAVVVMGIVILLCMSTSIELTDYVTIKTVSGYDGNGTVYYEIDTERFANDILEDQDVSEIPGAEYIFNKESRIKKLFDINIENNGSLSNGDTVTIEVKYDSRNTFGKTINNGVITKEVSGLEPTKKLDIFEFYDIYFYGINTQGNLGAGCKDETELEFYPPSVTFTSKSDGKLSNGDKVTVIATIDDYENCKEIALEYGYVFDEIQEKEFIVKDLDLLITKDDIKGEFLEEIIDIAKDETVGDSIFTSFTNAYVYCAEKTIEGDSETAVFVVVNFDSQIWSECTKAIVFSDCSKKIEDGKTTYSYSSYGVAELGNIMYSAISEEEVSSSLKSRYPDYKLTKIQ